MARMLLIDGSNHAFRVQFALPPRHASGGFPTRVLYGFTLLFQKMLNTWQPDYVVVSFDTGKNFRQDLYADYKGHRPEMPDDLRQQWPLLPELVEAFGYTAIMMEGFEADDVLGTLAKAHASDDLEVYLVTSDKDFMQLVDDDISILDEMKGKVLDEDDVEAKFGVGPDKVIDVQGLAGDSSDNVPGVSGIGVKTASKYVQEYGSLEAVLEAAAAGKIGGKRGQALVDEAEAAKLSKQLVTIKTDVPLELTLEDLAPRDLDEDKLRKLFDDWEFGKVARKLLPDQDTVDVTAFTVAEDADAVQAALSRVRSGELESFELAYDPEAGDDPLAAEPVGVAFGSTQGDGVWVDLELEGAREAVYALMAEETLPKLGCATKQAYRSLSVHGKGLAGVRGDVRLLDYVLSPHRRTHGLEDQASRHLAHTLGHGPGADEIDEAHEDAARAAEAANVIAALDARLNDKLEEGMRHVYEAIELPLIPVLAKMELAGIRLDTARLGEVDDDIAERVDALEKACHELAGREFKVRSVKEVQAVLFDELGLTPGKRTKTGYSTASGVLENIQHEHPLPGKILEYRQLDKLRGTYLTKLPTYVEEDGRIHTRFNQAVAATGRLSSVDPNLQNIPVRTFEGRRIRDCFVPADGCLFLSADYSQVELRVLAHFTEDPVLMEGFGADMDIHARTAVEVFGVSPDEVGTDERSAAKAINFGLIYGMSAFRLSNDLGIPREDAQAYMDRYFERMPAVQGWIEETKSFVHEHGWVETLYGRRRLIPEIHSRTFNERTAGEREAVNTRIQGTAADLIKLAMLRVDAALNEAGVEARLLLQVHDELLLEVPEAEVEQVTALVKREMEAAASLKVPLKVTTATGSTWNEAHG